MSVKILTVDDSNTVRRLIHKHLKGFDCVVVEASNGLEGLKAIAKEKPDLVLLDVTMPIMDGIQVLEKIRMSNTYRSLPVVMLTAEANKEMITRIVKLGIKDYIVKPFKAEVIIDKVQRITGLRALTSSELSAREETEKTKRIAKIEKFPSGKNIVLLEDKEAIVQQFQKGLHLVDCHIHPRTKAEDVFELCEHNAPDLIILSLSIQGEDAIELFRRIRSKLKASQVPIFALIVKLDSTAIASANDVGFNAIITKPLNIQQVEAKIAKTLNLDLSARYFKRMGNHLQISLTRELDAQACDDISQSLHTNFLSALDEGCSTVIVDLLAIDRLSDCMTKLILRIQGLADETGVQYVVAGNSSLSEHGDCPEEIANWEISSSIEEAMNKLTATVS